MGAFTATHNVTERPSGSWMSLHGYGAAHLAYGRLLLAGYDMSLHLWRDAKYDGMLEANGVTFRLEFKSTGVNDDPLENLKKASFSFVSNHRSGGQISREAPIRTQPVSTEDADFAVGISSHDGTIWIVPVELLRIIGEKPKINRMCIFKEKVEVFKGLNEGLDSRVIQEGFSGKKPRELEKICKDNGITPSNESRQRNFPYPWQKQPRTRDIKVDYKDSLVLDIWAHIFNQIGKSD